MSNHWLAKYRIDAGLTQEQLAVQAEVDRTYIAKIENGLRPSVRVAQNIAKVFGFSWTIFFEQICEENTQNVQGKQSSA